MESRKKIYIASDRVISALGFSTTENIAAIQCGCSGIRMQHEHALYEHDFPAARIDEKRLAEEAEEAGVDEYPKLEQLFILCIRTVLARTGLDLKNGECGLVLATTKGNIDRIHFTDAYLWKMAEHISGYFQAACLPAVVSNACISGISALLLASRWIEEGRYKHVIVAGGDLLTRFVVTGFESFKSVSSFPCKPYDIVRDGLSLGEACGAIALTAERELVKEQNPVVVAGGGITNDANHISGPSRTGDGLYYAIRSALDEAGLLPEEISCINAHGTATLYNDEMEAKALNRAGMQDIPMNSLKGYWGHTLGAAGIIESIACFEQLRQNKVWGTKGFSQSGVSLPLSLSADHRLCEMKHCLKTASGFGGCNAAVIFSLEKYSRDKELDTVAGIEVVRTCRIQNHEVMVDGEKKVCGEGTFGDFIRSAFKALEQPNMKFYKMDDLCKLGYTAVSWLLQGIETDGRNTGIVLSNSASSLDTDREHQTIIDQRGDLSASPAVFVYTLPNVVMGEICIRYKIQGENTFLVCREKSVEFLKEYACLLMRKKKLKNCIYGWCELDGEHYEAEMVLCRNSKEY